MSAPTIILSENDVVFGLQNYWKRNPATKRLYQVLRENREAHSNGNPNDKRNIELGVLSQIKAELPPSARFLRIVQEARLENEFDSYTLMTDEETLRAMAKAYIRLHTNHKSKEKQNKAKSWNDSSKFQEQALGHKDSEKSLRPVASTMATKFLYCKDHDVVFGKKGGAYTGGTSLLRDILWESCKVHSGAELWGRRRLEEDAIQAVKKELPPDARFLRFVPAHGSKKEYYRSMTNHEIRQAVMQMAGKMNSNQRQRDKKKMKATKAATLTVPKSLDTLSQNSKENTPRLAQESGMRTNAPLNQQPNPSNVQQSSFKGSKTATNSNQKPSEDVNTGGHIRKPFGIINDTAISTGKRIIEPSKTADSQKMAHTPALEH